MADVPSDGIILQVRLESGNYRKMFQMMKDRLFESLENACPAAFKHLIEEMLTCDPQ